MDDPLRLVGQLFPAPCHDYLYLVGGSVRDRLLGRPGRDLDLVTTLDPSVLQRLGFRPVQGRTTSLIWFLALPGEGTVEVTLLPEGSSLADDLRRRDFTMNALALTPDGRLLDPLNGRRDLEQRRVRSCSDTCFRDDPLRLFRALRFEAEGWRMTPETLALAGQPEVLNGLEGMPVERFSRELVKALAGTEPERFFSGMAALGAGRHWLPELFAMPAVPAGPPEYHPEGDLLTHSLQVLQRTATLTPDPLARFCGLLHDLGKLQSDPAHYPRHHGHDEAGFDPARRLCRRLRLPTAWGRALAWSCRLHTRMNRWPELRDATRLKTARQADQAGIAAILPLVSAADKAGTTVPPDWGLTLATARLNAAGLGVGEERLAVLPPEQRETFLLQRRIERLRAAAGREENENENGVR